MHLNMNHLRMDLRAVIGVGALALMFGCGGGGDKSTADTAAVGPAPARAGGPSSSSSASPGGRADSATITDANIMAAEIGGDSAEVVIARAVEPRASAGPVRAYAGTLIQDHGKSLAETHALSTRLGITPVPPTNDTTAAETAHVLARLAGLSGRVLDTAFVNHEVEDHKHDISEAHRMSAAARDPQIKALVDKSLPELQKHLARAQALGASGSK